MIIVQRSDRMMGLRIVDIYFPGAVDKVKFDGDIGVVLQAAAPTAGASVFHTLKIDLRKESEEIRAEMKKTTRYEIRRAEKDDPVIIDINIYPSFADICRYSDFFDGYFALHTGLDPCNRNRLRSLSEKGGIALSQARHEDGEILAAHANVLDYSGGRVRLLYSASCYRRNDSATFRALIGRVNRLLHWREMLHFKKLGFIFYDFGGIGGANATDKQQRIAEFKLGFGGEEYIEYNVVVGRTILGKTALAARKLIRK